MNNRIASKPFSGMSIDLWGRDDPVILVELHDSGRSADLWIGVLNAEEVAVKIYRPTFDDGGLFDESVAREHEVECDDPRIVSALFRGVINYPGSRWSHVLVMPLIDAECLRDVIKSGALDSGSKIAISNEIVKSLASFHECGMIHGDLNPANILAPEGGSKAYLIDFEFCLPIDMDRSDIDYSRERGTPGYIAPEIEQFGIRACSTSSDVWALGWVLAETLNNDGLPEDRDWRKHREKYGSKASMLNNWSSGYGGDIDDSVRRCVVIDRRHRIKMSEMVGSFESHVSQ